MGLVSKVSAYMSRHRMVERGCKVLVAVSGGPDSVVLLHVLRQLQEELEITLHVAHLNHMFRGAESEEDALFVQKTAGRYGLPVTVKSIDVPSLCKRARLSKQVAARQARYNFLNETAGQTGASKVALAHQADDQAETILINFLRGAGITGLKGILPVRDDFYIRPLLTVRRAEIELYCRDADLPFRRDSSNIKPVYARNRIRLNLMPLLEKEYNPGLVPALLRLGDICQEEDACLEKLAGEAFAGTCLARAGGGVALGLAELQGMPVAISRRVLRKAWEATTGSPRGLSFQHVEAVLDLINSGRTGARVILPGQVVAARSYSTLELMKEQERRKTPYYIYPLHAPGATFIPEIGCTIHASMLPLPQFQDPKNLPPSEALLDYDKLPPVIFVRRRQDGDVFSPYGQVSELKLKDFLINLKIPREERDSIPLVSTPGEIIWVAGLRVGEKWKVDENTKRLLRLKVVSGARMAGRTLINE